MPAELYARWVPLKQRYIGRDNDVEEWRPIFAAQELYEEAIRSVGFESFGVIWPTVEKLARKAKVTITEPEVTVKEVEEARMAELDPAALAVELREGDEKFGEGVLFAAEQVGESDGSFGCVHLNI